MIRIERLPSPIGPFAIATRDGLVAGASFHGEREAPFAWLARRYPEETVEEGPPVSDAALALAEYFRDPDTDLSALPLHFEGSEFEVQVWNALREIPCGEVVSYGWLARKVGQPQAAQAVGRANGRNPIPIIVPCHRVIGLDGSLTGFGGGVRRKEWLLDHERGGRLL